MQTKQLDQYKKICRATGGVKDILENFDKETGIHKQSTQHTTRSSYADEYEMIQDLLHLDPFSHINNRQHNSFADALHYYIYKL